MHLAAFVLLASVLAVGQNTDPASTPDGNGLLLRCAAALRAVDNNFHIASGDSFNTGRCTGFIEGVKDAMYASGWLSDEQHARGTGVCLPEPEIDNAQVLRIMVKWLQDHPAKLNEHQYLLAHLALLDAYPCKEKK